MSPGGSYLYKLSRSPGDNELAFTGQKIDPVNKTYTNRSLPNHPGRQVGTATVVISSLNWPKALRGPGIFCHGRQTLDIVQSGALTSPRQFIPKLLQCGVISDPRRVMCWQPCWPTQPFRGPTTASVQSYGSRPWSHSSSKSSES